MTARCRENDKEDAGARAKAGQSTKAVRKRTDSASVGLLRQPSLTQVPPTAPNALKYVSLLWWIQKLHQPVNTGTALDVFDEGSLKPMQEYLASKFGHKEATKVAGQGHVLAIELSGTSYSAALLVQILHEFCQPLMRAWE